MVARLSARMSFRWTDRPEDSGLVGLSEQGRDGRRAQTGLAPVHLAMLVRQDILDASGKFGGE